jgi:hypothetical protein
MMLVMAKFFIFFKIFVDCQRSTIYNCIQWLSSSIVVIFTSSLRQQAGHISWIYVLCWQPAQMPDTECFLERSGNPDLTGVLDSDLARYSVNSTDM